MACWSALLVSYCFFRRLILKTDEVKKKQQVIDEQDRMINVLRNSMKRQPGIYEAEMINQYQETVKEKTHQLLVRPNKTQPSSSNLDKMLQKPQKLFKF